MNEQHFDLVKSWFLDLRIKDIAPPTHKEMRDEYIPDSHVITAAGRPAGYLRGFTWGTDNYYLLHFVIDAGFRRRSIGKQAMQLLAEQSRRAGYKTLSLDCDVTHLDALRFYKEKVGMQSTGNTWHFIVSKRQFRQLPIREGYHAAQVTAADIDVIGDRWERHNVSQESLRARLESASPTLAVRDSSGNIVALSYTLSMAQYSTCAVVEDPHAWPVLFNYELDFALKARNELDLMHIWIRDCAVARDAILSSGLVEGIAETFEVLKMRLA